MTTPRFHPPQQTRSQETLDRLLDAAEQVLEEKSFTEATLAEIVERAGVTVGAFYRRFPDKDALLHLLDQRFFDELYALADDVLSPERWAGESISAIVHAIAHHAGTIYRERRGLLRSLFLRARVDPVIQDSARRVNARFLERLHAVLAPHRAEIRHPDPDRAITLGFIVLIGAVRETVVFGEVWPDIAQVAEGLDDELATMYLAYLGAGAQLGTAGRRRPDLDPLPAPG